MAEQNQSPSPTLVRGLGLFDASTIVIGCVIGAGIFRLSDSVAQHSPSAFMFMLAWVVGGLLSLTGALCFAELSTLYPKSGGDYVFLTEGYGRVWGFVFGWTKLFVQRTGTIAIISYIFAEHACRAFQWPMTYAKLLATGAILFITIANILGLRFGKSIQNVFTSLKVLAIGFIILVGLSFNKGSIHNFQPFWPEWSGDLISTLGVALIFVLWTYGGWEGAAHVAEEVKDPERNVPRALIGGLLTTMGLYLLVNAVYLYYMPLAEMRATDLVAAGTMDKVWPNLGGRVVAVMVLISTLGALNGFILATSRVLYALGKDHALFNALGRLHPATRTPIRSLVTSSAISLLLVWTGTLDQIVTYTEIVIYVLFGMTGITLFIFRRRGMKAAYRVWGYPVVPIAFILMCFAFAANAFIEQPREALLGVLVASIGFPLYFLSERLSRRD